MNIFDKTITTEATTNICEFDPDAIKLCMEHLRIKQLLDNLYLPFAQPKMKESNEGAWRMQCGIKVAGPDDGLCIKTACT